MAYVSGKVSSYSSNGSGSTSRKNALHVLAAFLVLIAVGFGVVRAMNSSLFKLKNIVVEPISEGYPLTQAQILQMAKVQMGNQSLFDFKMQPIESRLVKNPWVKGVVIGKQFPDTLSLKVVERQPIALLNESRGKVVYLEADGTVFEDSSIVYAKDLPILQGFSIKDETQMKQLHTLMFDWFKEADFPGLKLSSLSFDSRMGLRAVVVYPLKNGNFMRPVVELGLNLDEALMITQPSLRKVLDYLSGKSLPASKIWLGDGKKIVVKMSRDS
jgi:hypothetical protein